VRSLALKLLLFVISIALNLLLIYTIKFSASSSTPVKELKVSLIKPLPEKHEQKEEKSKHKVKMAKIKPKPTKVEKRQEEMKRIEKPEVEKKENKQESAEAETEDAGETEANQVINEVAGSDNAGEPEAQVGEADGEQSAFSEDDIKKALDDYRKALYTLIERNKVYPPIARRLGHQGKVRISFVVLIDGSLGQVKVELSSGYVELDEAAVRAVKDASPFPPLPEEIQADAKSFVVTISFELNS